VLDDAAMPHKAARPVVGGLHPRDLAWVGDHRALQARLPQLRTARLFPERLSVYDLELHLVDVDGVGILGEVVLLAVVPAM
jgi:hypothetical protein